VGGVFSRDRSQCGGGLRSQGRRFHPPDGLDQGRPRWGRGCRRRCRCRVSGCRYGNPPAAARAVDWPPRHLRGHPDCGPTLGTGGGKRQRNTSGLGPVGGRPVTGGIQPGRDNLVIIDLLARGRQGGKPHCTQSPGPPGLSHLLPAAHWTATGLVIIFDPETLHCGQQIVASLLAPLYTFWLRRATRALRE
jgi:hypothetical protein